MHSYPFERKTLTVNYDKTTLTTLKKDSLGSVLNYFLNNGSTFFKEFKKAGLKNPNKISF